MIDRKTAPDFKTINKVDVIRAKEHSLSNGVKVYSVVAGSQEITKLEFIFKAGTFFQPNTLISNTTNALIESGTKSYSANQLSDGIDFYGSFLELSADLDFASVKLYSLNKFLEPTLKYLEEIIKFPTFPDDEFKIHITNKKQKHIINSQKVSVLAKRKFGEMLFGESHPYGKIVAEVDYDRISVSEIRDFFSKYYSHSNCTIVASGNLPSSLYETIEKYFGNSWSLESVRLERIESKIISSSIRKNFIHRDDAVQSALRIGKILFNKTHEDYCKFQVLNTVFGGYFGSRLMANIREDKGYTYGIGSGLASLVHTGYFYISAEVGADVTQKAIDEIYKEMKIMREELIDEQELETVRNYILGHFLRSVDGAFALADKFKGVWEFGLDYDFYDRYFHSVKNVKPKELRDLANKYLNESTMLECVVGKMR